jgi:hypothetical protein
MNSSISRTDTDRTTPLIGGVCPSDFRTTGQTNRTCPILDNKEDPSLFWSFRSIERVHKRIHHASKVYVDGDIHTNSIEGFWSLVKNGLRGGYHSVSQKYLPTYLDEYSFRYNRRNQEQPMFQSITERLSQVRYGRYGHYRET